MATKKKTGGSDLRDKAKSLLRTKLKGLTVPEPGLIAAEFIANAGGPKNFGRILWDEFNRSPAGSVARQRLLTMIMQFAKSATDSSHSADDLDELDTPELESVFLQLAQRAGIIDSAQPTSTGPTPSTVGETEANPEAPREAEPATAEAGEAPDHGAGGDINAPAGAPT